MISISDIQIRAIQKLKAEKNAVVLGHFYIDGELQDISDFVGDSLQLSQEAARTNADIIVFLGVYFMAETAKILSPDKKVLIPDILAGCSLADSCNAEVFKKFLENYPGHTVITYVNTTAEIKAMSDITVTSSNAYKIVNSLPVDEKIVFAPDRNLGNYINSVTGRNMVLFNGACHVHEQFSLEAVLALKKQHPEAVVLAHPECEAPVRMLADFIGSTSALLKYAINSTNSVFIVATESGILHQMKKLCSNKLFIPVPGIDSTCGCNDCSYMKLNTVEKLYRCLSEEIHEVHVDKDIALKARKAIQRMLDLSV
ncbi:MAG TPA: quinolinate synthase NadA [Bacteroidales bacterium]|nr:quinolinate synthase NadA [Bacteroidales bacterium]